MATYSNCYFVTFYLFMRLRNIQRFVAVSSLSSWFPYHFLVINKRGHALHFNHALPHELNTFAPFWFLGKIEGIRLSKQQKMLAKMNRKVCVDSTNIALTIFAFHIIFFTLYLLWMISWTAYPILWTTWSWIKTCPIFPWRRK